MLLQGMREGSAMSEPSRPISTDRQTGRDERSGADRCWIWRNVFHETCVSFSRPDPKAHPSVEYMRVLSRQEVDRLYNGAEGVDVMQLVNSLHRQIEGQRRHIANLTRKLEELENPSAHVAAGVTGHD